MTSDCWNLKSLNNLEWCVELPTSKCPRKSPAIQTKGNEWFFEFVLENCSGEWYFDLYLVFKSTHTEFNSCNGSLEIGFVNEQTLSVGKNAFRVKEPKKTEIWWIKLKDMQPKLPSDYFCGNWIKFIFRFEDIVFPLKIDKVVEDKCVQTASYLNAGVAVESVCEDFSGLLDSGPNHDAEIICGEHSIKAHKVVLCSRSEVLSAMLQSNMLEGRTGIIEIKDMEISYVQEFLRYLYTGTMPELTFDKAKILYEAGDKYAVRSLMFRCSEYLQDSISSENVFQCFELGDKHSDQELKNKVVSYILEKKTYLDEEIWMSFCKTYPETAIEVYRLSHKTQEMKDM